VAPDARGEQRWRPARVGRPLGRSAGDGDDGQAALAAWRFDGDEIADAMAEQGPRDQA
jgi:hypothetical protein